MTQKFYVDDGGVYLGSYDGVSAPEDSIEVMIAPNNGSQVWNGSSWDNPPAIWADVATLQNEMFEENNETKKRFARYSRHTLHTGKTPKESPAKFQEILQYYQDIEDADETTYATPQEALDALNALTEPTE